MGGKVGAEEGGAEGVWGGGGTHRIMQPGSGLQPEYYARPVVVTWATEAANRSVFTLSERDTGQRASINRPGDERRSCFSNHAAPPPIHSFGVVATATLRSLRTLELGNPWCHVTDHESFRAVGQRILVCV